MDGGSECTAIDMTSVFDVSDFLWFDLENNKIVAIVNGIGNVGSRNGVDGHNGVNGVVIIESWDWWTTANVDRSNWCVKTKIEHVIVMSGVSGSKWCYRRNPIRIF